MFVDEMLGNICKQPDLKMIVCNRCGAYWSLNYIEERLEEFTDEESRQIIISQRIERYNRYKQVEIIEPVVNESKIKRKRKPIETSGERPISSF